MEITALHIPDDFMKVNIPGHKCPSRISRLGTVQGQAVNMILLANEFLCGVHEFVEARNNTIRGRDTDTEVSALSSIISFRTLRLN